MPWSKTGIPIREFQKGLEQWQNHWNKCIASQPKNSELGIWVCKIRHTSIKKE